MAAKTVSAKCSVKDIFNKDLTPVALKQCKATIQTLVDKEKPALEYKDGGKEGFLLTVSLSVLADDESKPSSLEAKVSITGVAVGGTASGFKASGNAKASGINAKKLEEEAKFIVGEAVGSLMTNKVIPQMTA